MASIAHVAVRTPIAETLAYRLDPSLVCQVGQRLKVPLGRREVVGVLVALSDAADCPEEKLKSVIEVLEQEAIVTPTLLQLYRWAAAYYQMPLGEAMLGTLPKAVRLGKPRVDQTTVACQAGKKEAHKCLTDEQQQAVDAMRAARLFSVFCLRGVTGSGKTEVYWQVMQPLLAAGQQVLLLVPEIGLIPQTLQRLRARFSTPVVCYHSEMTDLMRHRAWYDASSGRAQVVVGTRSAVFLPMPQLALIVVDESQDLSYKQQSGFLYSGRDVALKRAQIESIPIILGSATPSLETMHHCQQGRYQQYLLSQRAQEAVMPQLSIVDLRATKTHNGLAPVVLEAVSTELALGNQVLLFLNRRGWAPRYLCHHCAWIASCPRCDSHLTLHHDPAGLWCHHCGCRQSVPSVCPSCRQCECAAMGCGTEQLETVLQAHFPDEQVLRFDRDSTRHKGAFAAKLDQVQSGQARLLIGTQMLSKGHHFPQLSLVVVVDADTGLYGQDFRGLERMVQALMQVAGRAGRGKTVGRVLVQTHFPEHPVMTLLCQQDYQSISTWLLKEREQLMLPPYSYLVLLRAQGPELEPVLAWCRAVKAKLPRCSAVVCCGPALAPMSRVANRYRAQVLLTSADRRALIQMTVALRGACRAQKDRRIRWSIDVDAQDCTS